MPKRGFYVWNASKYDPSWKSPDLKDEMSLSVVFCSGDTKGNYYWDPKNHSPRWNFLTWTCVPTVKLADKEYDYYSENPISVPIP